MCHFRQLANKSRVFNNPFQTANILNMELTFIGHSCFKIKGKDTTIVIDPYNAQIGYKLPKLECDVLCVTHDHPDHNNVAGVTGYESVTDMKSVPASFVGQNKHLINGPGEYEINGAFINGISTYHDDKKGAERGEQTIYLIDIDGVSILHLGDLGHTLSQEVLEKLSRVDVLLIPVGGVTTIDAEKAAEVISSIEPGIVIPMHYATPDFTGGLTLGSLEKFLDEMGVKAPRHEDKLKMSSRNEAPEETEVVVLNPAH